MTGGEGSLSRGAAKSAAAVTGPQNKRYPTKRTAKKAAAAAATVPHASSKHKGCSTKRKATKDQASGRMPRPRATRSKAKEEEAPAAGKSKHLMSQGDIRWILAQKPMAPPARYAALKRSNPELTPRPDEEADEDKVRLYVVVKAFYEMEERLPRMQEWVRSELKSKGHVELDEETVRRKAEAQATIDREWPAIEAKMKGLILSEKADRVGDESDSDEGEDDGSDDEGEYYSD